MKTPLAILVVFLFIFSFRNLHAQTNSQTFTYTGSEQTFVVPAGVTQMTFKIWGAGGGSGTYSSYGGGAGGYTEASVSTTPGQTLVLIVGDGGKYGASNGNGGLGGWPGGGYGTRGDASGGGGGGYSGVFITNHTHANSLLIAGGGGAGTGYRYGGAGSGLNGNIGHNGGYGGTQAAGGTGSSGADGSALQGGNGDAYGLRTSGSYDGGGGGGGYYGGEGGYSDAGGGGGGSGYVNATYLQGTATRSTGNDGSWGIGGLPPNTLAVQYVSGIGVGGLLSTNGGNGLIYASWTVSGPMIYSNATTTMASITDAYQGADDNPILRLEVQTSGVLNALSVSQIKFSTLGTSSLTDISGIKLFYTTTTTFSNATQFGSTINSVSDTITFTANQVLSYGSNYFWLTFNVDTDALVGNVLDGECLSITVSDTLRYPTISAPTGSRPIVDPITAISTFTASSSDLFAGDVEAPIIYCQIVNGAESGRISINSLIFNTLGTSNAADISTAKVYYTTLSTFSNSTIFGTSTSNPSGVFTISGNQTLAKGSNYFWLVYDISNMASANNSVDAACNSIQIKGISRTPSIQEPTGNRTIILPSTPSTQASNLTFSSVTNNAMAVNWTSGNGAKRVVFAKLGNSGSPSPVSSTTYTGNTIFSQGSQIGSSGWYCVYNGTGNSFTLTGLSSYATYQLQVCEYNGAAGNEVYLSATATNNPKYQSTLAFSGGNGTIGNPYQVEFANDLLYISLTSSLWSSYFIQIANITFDADSSLVDWNLNGSADGSASAGFSPIGNLSTNFNGYYNGNGKSISNLYICRPLTDYIGLFGYIGTNSTLTNITITNASITGGNYTGSLIGYMNTDSKSYSNSSSGSVKGIGNTGGLIGYAYSSKAFNCNSSANVTASANYCGGLVGHGYYAYFQLCFASGSVTGTSNVGGLTGENYSNTYESYVIDCYSNGSVSGSGSNIGGLMGMQQYAGSYITNSYSVSAVSSSKGLTGNNANCTSYAVNSFYSTTICATSSTGTGKTSAEMKLASTYTAASWDFVNESTNGVKNYWKIDANINNGFPVFAWQGESSSAPTVQAVDVNLTSVGATQFTINWGNGNGDSRVVFVKEANTGTCSPVNSTTYTASATFGSGTEIGSGWYCVYNGTGSRLTLTGLTANKTYMIQVFEYKGTAGNEIFLTSLSYNNPKKDYTMPIEPIMPTGSGTSGSPYLIASLNNLFYVSLNYKSFGSTYFKQTANIDASSTSTWYDGAGFIPMGDWDSQFPYYGGYNGDNHTITGLHINRPEGKCTGLFGRIGYQVTISNLGLIDVDITGGNYTGALFGDNPFSGNYITNCYATGNIKSNGSYVGGLIGSNYQAQITNCYANCDIDLIDTLNTTASARGGFIGHHAAGSYGALYKCYAAGNVRGYDKVGGFAGEIESNIYYCYSRGDVLGHDYIGGFGGYGNWSSSSASTCFTTGSVTGIGTYVGPFVGSFGSHTASNCVWNVELDNIYGNISGVTLNSAVGKTTNEMLQQSTYEGLSWDFSTVWTINPDYNDGYPYLISVTPQATVVYTWTGAVSTNWNLATNWLIGTSIPSQAPSSTDDIRVPNVVNNLDITSTPQYNDLIIFANTTLSMNSNISLNGFLALNSNLNLNGKTIDLGFTGSLVESAGLLSGDSGKIIATRVLNNSNENVAGLGVKITTSANMGSTTIERTHAPIGTSIKRVFKINPTNNAGLNASLVFYYDETELNGNNENNLVLFKSSDNGNTWVEVGGARNTTANTLTLTGINSFSWWTIDEAGTVLPIQLTHFDAQCTLQNQVLCSWTTASEKNNDYFNIEASIDAVNFTALATIKGAGNSSSNLSYTHLLNSNSKQYSYFRLKQTDYDGAFSYSSIVYSNCLQQNEHASVLPNPFNQKFEITFTAEQQNIDVTVFDNCGKIMYSSHFAQTSSININTQLWPTGMYYLKVMSDSMLLHQKLIKK